MSNVHRIGDFGPRISRWANVVVAYARLSLSGTLPAGQWAFSPQWPFRPLHILTWLAPGPGVPGAMLTALQINGESHLEAAVPARAFEAPFSIEAFLGHHLKCSGAGECPMCRALATRPPVLELLGVERVASKAMIGFALDLPAVEVGGRCALEHGELCGVALLGIEARQT